MVLIKILVAIILTELQRFESRANVKKTNAADPKISRPKRTPEANMVRNDVICEVNIGFALKSYKIFPKPETFLPKSSSPDLHAILKIFFTFFSTFKAL